MKPNKLGLIGVGLAFWFTGGSSACAGSVAAFPASARLDHGRDIQRFALIHTREDGITEDVTSLASWVFDRTGVATLQDGLFLAPVSDGTATLRGDWNGQSVSIPVEVLNSAVVKRISFQHDVEPILMKAGCNSGACHGSAQGKNGFRLSLFGYDPGLDYLNLTREVRGRRMDVSHPEDSLMLLKPMGIVDHEGGVRVQPDSPDYRTMVQWITEGAENDPAEIEQLTGLEIIPPSCVLEIGKSHPFVVRATYSNGTDRDVTELSILATSDDSILGVDPSGKATAKSKGEVYVLARFGSFAVVSKAMVLDPSATLVWPDVVARNQIDEQVLGKLRNLRIPPAPVCSDSVFLRRVYIDILGVLPTAEESRAFLTDTDTDKRSKLVSALLARPEFPEVWAMKWADLLRVKSSAVLSAKAMHRYNDWLRESVASGKPIDDMVIELLTAQGGTFASPPANFYVIEPEPIQIAENVAQVFLGIQIKCAQCHNHPFERWTMDDYYSFAAFFSQVGRKAATDPRESIVFDRRSGEVTNIKDGRQMPPKFLGGTAPEAANVDRRKLLAEWLVSPENPWFAKNIANRVWAHFFGRGIIDPPDDVRVTNPPSHPELLESLGKDLAANGYDLRGLVAQICNSYTYQMSTDPTDPANQDARNYSHSQIRRLPSEQLLDAIALVAQTDYKFANLPLGSRAIQVADGNSGNYFLSLFGRPPRDTVCACERRNEPTLGQALHLINGDTIQTAIQAPGGRLTRLKDTAVTPDQAIEEVYLAAYSRFPSETERAELNQYLQSAADRNLALEDIFWSVLNSKEFIFNH